MITVNLTTTFQRLSLCRIALTSLLMQTWLPHRINLWVSEEPYLRDKGIGEVGVMDQFVESLPDSARNLLNIRWVPNTGPYRKLIPMLREAGPDDVIVTADDDIFYGQAWLSGLLQAYADAEGMPVAARVRKKRINFLGKSTSYLHWKLMHHPSIMDDDFVVTFGGGAVLSRAMFREQDIADDSFLMLAPTADDLWYSKLLKMNHQYIVAVPSVLDELNFIQHNDSLMSANYPWVTSLVQKVRLHVWDRALGFFGVAVCGNDEAYAQIEHYFSRRHAG